jgi:hypothetical protein
MTYKLENPLTLPTGRQAQKATELFALKRSSTNSILSLGSII